MTGDGHISVVDVVVAPITYDLILGEPCLFEDSPGIDLIAFHVLSSETLSPNPQPGVPLHSDTELRQHPQSYFLD